jgi:ATP-dependent DNA helicase RecQ
MKLVIVAKTRMRGGACVGAITFDGQSVRLIDPKQDTGDHFNLEYEVGEVWEVEGERPETIRPPHVENIVVRGKRRLQKVSLDRVVGFIEKVMPPASGGPEQLYEALVRKAPGGALFIAEQEDLPGRGIPHRSTMFWRPDRDLVRDEGSKRIRYRYPSPDGGVTLTFVGFQEPPPLIPAGTLVRVSLAHWWRPGDHPDAELRCYVQMSGWFSRDGLPAEEKVFAPAQTGTETERSRACARALLKTVFGYDDFLLLQAEIIDNVLAGHDTLAIMPTGGGKSLCYQLPALIFDGLTVVISPLISLMQDQVDALKQLGVQAAFLNGTVDYHTYTQTMTAAREGRIKLLYLAPETLLRPETLVMLDRSKVACLTIDEAHCISSWGHDFRPEYRQLLPVRRRYPQAVCIALTATATKRVQEDIKQILGFGDANSFVAGFNRPNLYLAAQPRTDGLSQMLAFLKAHPGQSGIIYCQTRKAVDLVTEQLVQAGHDALPYHAGLEDALRRDHQRRFSRDETQVMVATIAFGMGINKSNIRFILHMALPENLENYYQQIGRAGRDGLHADCLLLWAAKDIHVIRHFIDEGPESERRGKEERLRAMLAYAQATGCRRVPLLAYFGEKAPDACNMCDNCVAAAGATGQATVDVSGSARLLVECVRITGGRFGAEHVVQVLRGSRARSISQWKHDRLAMYGHGRHLKASEWRDLAQRLVGLGILQYDDRHGNLALGPRAKEVLDGAPVLIPAAWEPVVPVPAETHGHQRGLFEQLRTLRAELARAADVPAFVVFSDRTLQEMAKRLPTTPQGLRRVPGIGERKLAQYGEQFLAVIRAYSAAHPDAAHPLEPPRPQAGLTESQRRMEIGEFFKAGLSVEDLRRLYGAKADTIIGHLAEYQRDGNSVDGSRLLPYCTLPLSEHPRVLGLFVELGTDALRPVYDALDGQVTFSDLRILRIYCLSLKFQPSPEPKDE